MELLIIFLILETCSFLLAFVFTDSNMATNIIVFALLAGIGTPMLTMMIFDRYIYMVKEARKYHKIIRLSKLKYKFTINSKARNGILLDLAPFYFMVEDNQSAINNLKQIDFLAYRNPDLKAYYQLLMAYSRYVEKDFDKVPDYLESALSYTKLVKEAVELFHIALKLENLDSNSNNSIQDLIKQFKELPDNPREFYIEPFDKLYKDVEKKLGIS